MNQSLLISWIEFLEKQYLMTIDINSFCWKLWFPRGCTIEEFVKKYHYVYKDMF